MCVCVCLCVCVCVRACVYVCVYVCTRTRRAYNQGGQSLDLIKLMKTQKPDVYLKIISSLTALSSIYTCVFTCVCACVCVCGTVCRCVGSVNNL